MKVLEQKINSRQFSPKSAEIYFINIGVGLVTQILLRLDEHCKAVSRFSSNHDKYKELSAKPRNKTPFFLHWFYNQTAEELCFCGLSKNCSIKMQM